MIDASCYVCQWASPAARMRPAQRGPRTVYCFLKHDRVYMRAT